MGEPFLCNAWTFGLANENLLGCAKVCTVYADNVNALRNFRKLDCVRSGRKVRAEVLHELSLQREEAYVRAGRDSEL